MSVIVKCILKWAFANGKINFRSPRLQGDAREQFEVTIIETARVEGIKGVREGLR
jgi:hypothetical protein